MARSTVDALGFEEVNQEAPTGSVFATIISGANLFATGSVQADRITADVLFRDKNGQVRSVGTGSTTTWGNLIQAGSAGLSAGSLVTVIFGQAFSAPPFVTVSYANSVSSQGAVVGSRVNAGSILFTGDTASKDISWIAVGAAAA